MHSNKENCAHEFGRSSIVVTGGAGFIGSNLVKELSQFRPKKLIVVDNFLLESNTGKQRGLDVLKDITYPFRMIRGDAANYKFMQNIMSENEVDIVFDLAILGLPLALERPREVFDTNVGIASTLCELIRNDFYKVLIHFSSSEVFGSGIYVPMDEEHPLKPSTSYGASKCSQDLLALSYYNTYGTDVRIIRPFNNIGKGQNDLSYSAVVPRTIRRILSGDPPVIFGDGLQTRDFVFVSETCRCAIEIACRNDLKGEVINIGSGKETRIVDLVTKICQVMRYRGQILYEPARPGDLRRHWADTKKAQRLLDFSPTVSLEDAVRTVVEWYNTYL